VVVLFHQGVPAYRLTHIQSMPLGQVTLPLVSSDSKTFSVRQERRRRIHGRESSDGHVLRTYISWFSPLKVGGREATRVLSRCVYETTRN
jgi:hypothetical protein